MRHSGAPSHHSPHQRRSEGRAIRSLQRRSTESPLTLRRLVVVIIAGVAGVIAFAVYGQVAQSRQLDTRVAALAGGNVTLQQQIADRQREIVEAQTAAWLEEEARRLGYVLPGEHVYVVVPPGVTTPARGGVAVPLPTYFPLPTPTPAHTPSPPGASPTPSPAAASPTPSPTPSPR